MAPYFELTEAFYGDDWSFTPMQEEATKGYSGDAVGQLLQLASTNAQEGAVEAGRQEKVKALTDLVRGCRQEARTSDPLTQILRRNR